MTKNYNKTCKKCEFVNTKKDVKVEVFIDNKYGRFNLIGGGKFK